MPIWSYAWLNHLDLSRAKGEELAVNQYPIAMNPVTKGMDEEIAVWNFTAAVTLALVKARLAIAKQKGEEELKSLAGDTRFIKRIQDLFDVIFEDETVTAETFRRHGLQ